MLLYYTIYSEIMGKYFNTDPCLQAPKQFRQFLVMHAVLSFLCAASKFTYKTMHSNLE